MRTPQSGSLRLRNTNVIKLALIFESEKRLHGIFDRNLGIDTRNDEYIDLFRAGEGFTDHIDGVAKVLLSGK